ncbi:MAG TPA: gluconate 2-dehydrogenase subunit 3 family protein [Solimonas sp.]|nr:gluconate 2-dehydrogenase subunit 3 family protein [Solimonas sp.]
MAEGNKDKGAGLSRREFVAGSAAGLAVALGGCARSDAPGATRASAGEVDTRLAAFAFDEAQRRALIAAVNCLIPASGPGDWNAEDAGAVDYIEQLLNAFSGGDTPKIYAQDARSGGFQRLPRVTAQGWMQEVLRLREVYLLGLNELNRAARGPLSLLPGDFAGAPVAQQIVILETQDLQDTPFFATLYRHTMEGVYGHPAYGGNRDRIAWNSHCYEGDVHGRRYPGGHDPNADDRPWDQFGGYSPEDIAAPGKTCGD